MQKIMLTGSNGFLGQKLLQAMLEAADFEILAVSRGPNRYTGMGAYRYQQLDIGQPKALRETIQNFRPEIILHTVALAQVEVCERQPQLAYAVNSDPVNQMVALCKEFDVKLIFLSTDFIFDGNGGPYVEHDPARPLNVYGKSKLAAEESIRKADISWAIIRTILVYGVPHDPARSNFVLWVKNSLEQKKQLNIVTDHSRMPTLVEDLVDACLQIIRKEKEGVYHISGPERFSMYALALAIADFWNLEAGLLEPVPSSEQSSEVLRPLFTGFLLDKAKEQLDYVPRTLKEGLTLMDQQLKGKA